VAILRGLLKLVSLLVGLGVTVLGLTALAGAVVENGWVRLGIAIVIALGPPLFLADRLIPRDDPVGAVGIPTDVLAVSWLAIATLLVWLAGGPLRGVWIADAERHWKAGRTEVARVELRLAGRRVVTKAPTKAPARPPAKRAATKR
jgi:hypothetical protein